MNINKKFIILLGSLVLLIIIIFGFRAYYAGQLEVIFHQNYPVSLEETKLLKQDCSEGLIAFKNQGIIGEEEMEAIVCILAQTQERSGQYMNTLRLLKETPVFSQGEYVSIALNYNDLLYKNISASVPENSFNVCVVTQPVLPDPFVDQSFVENDIIFSDGEVFCYKFMDLPSKTLNLVISGFIPQADELGAEIYLISEDEIIDQILSQNSLEGIKGILQSYPILWEMKKTII